MKMKNRKSTVVAGTLMLLSAVAQPTITAYAAGPGEAMNVEQQSQAIVTYSQAQVATLGNWEQQPDGTWKFKAFTGEYLTSAWLESQTEVGCWYFLDSNGIMLVSTTTPDGYYVNQNGEWRAATSTTTSHSTAQQTNTSTQQTATSNASNTSTQSSQEFIPTESTVNAVEKISMAPEEYHVDLFH